MAALSVPVARWLADPAAPAWHPLWTLPLGAATLLLAGIPFRLSLQYWRFAAIGDLLTVAASAGLGAALFAALSDIHQPNAAFPVIHALTLLVALGTPRVVYRWRRGRPANQAQLDATSILLVGSIEDADLFIRALAQDRRQAFRVEGLLTPSDRQAGRRIQGHRILGSLTDAAAILEQLHAEDRLPGTLVFVTPELAGTRLAQVIAQADRFGLQVRQAPRPTALAHHGQPRPVELRPVAIEDLLNRPQVPLDRDGMARLIQGRRVIVTGAGGTIGSELARQVAAFGPGTLILLDNGEYALWQIDLELAESHPQVTRKTLIADIRDEARIHAIFQEHRPELVFHAAALKHVPMVEANPLEGMATNAAGTRHVADAARATGALAMVLISTGKAVNPTSVMGASK
ncbi:MAG TPA: polysaccharide biosynthesis protein, partial [Rhodopila sp.]|nr:polysaccharide biosynthesis protein [Rhodopila sp.]